MQEKEMHKLQQQGIDQHEWILNLSSRVLTNTEERILQRGLNFATTPRKIPSMDVIAAVEGAARRLNIEEGSELRGSVCGLLKRARPPPFSMHKEERAALKTLKQDKNVIILRADK